MLKLLRGDGNERGPTPSKVGANKRKTEIRNHISETVERRCYVNDV
ncbi:hypothetical protein TcasGA2_TC032971 [Tribolium castaneum]|uniref:Uncharacterized protein n=1 Tax=Tribolium castaneum TaxID=7070 RepID=A0A139WNQ6_TRICA|nr:hypothetical protein TcasGA2_TC032971 [Tribolium castaneum]